MNSTIEFMVKTNTIRSNYRGLIRQTLKIR